MAASSGAAHAVALSSGTAALHLALVVHGVGAGRRGAGVGPHLRGLRQRHRATSGATPVLIDSDPATWNLSPELLAEELAARRAAHPRRPSSSTSTARCADHHAIGAAARRARGAAPRRRRREPRRHLRRVDRRRRYGACRRAVVQRQQDHHHHRRRDARHRRRRGGRPGAPPATQAREPVPHYEHAEVGYNYRLSNLLAAFGRAQLADLDRRVERRRAIFDRYVAGCSADCRASTFMPEAPTGRSNRWLTCITIDASAAGFTADGSARAPRGARHRGPAHLEADAPAAGVQGLPSRLDGTSARLFERACACRAGAA